MNTDERKPGTRESLHVRSILIEPIVGDSGDLFCGKKMVDKVSLKDPATGSVSFVKLKCAVKNGMVKVGSKSFVLPNVLATRLMGKSGDSCIIETIIARLHVGDRPLILVCTPFLPALRELLQGITPTFFRADLRRVCDDQFKGATDANIKIPRLHSKLEGDKGERISSLTFIGKNVLTSAVIRDILRYAQERSRLATPFSVEALTKDVVGRGLDPVSCRIKWDDGSGVGVALNLDRYGNFSFYLKNEETISDLFPIFSYLTKTNALFPTPIDPFTRSDAALHEIDKQ